MSFTALSASLNPIQRQVEELREKARLRVAPVEQPPARTETEPKPSQLPLWPEVARGVPNSVLRSALFGAIKRGRRAFMQRQELAAVDGVTILFTGPRLDQADLDVWEQCLHLARTSGLGCRIQFAAYGFLRAIGRSTGGKDVEWLKGAFARLASSVVEIKDGRRAYFGPMLHHGTRDDETGHYVLEINPAIVALYGRDTWTQIEWQQRLALKGRPLAQWLHGYYTTHADPFPLKVATVHRLSGSEAKQLKHFRAELREALGNVEQATGWAWEIDSADLVHVHRTPTKSQAKHLRKRRTARDSTDRHGARDSADLDTG